jgi:hypothetical protein
MRILVVLAFSLGLILSRSALAQPWESDSAGGNLGSWKWGNSQTASGEEEGEEREPGETSWERLDAERSSETEESPKTALPQSLTPLELWHLLRGNKDEQKSEE